MKKVILGSLATMLASSGLALAQQPWPYWGPPARPPMQPVWPAAYMPPPPPMMPMPMNQGMMPMMPMGQGMMQPMMPMGQGMMPMGQGPMPMGQGPMPMQMVPVVMVPVMVQNPGVPQVVSSMDPRPGTLLWANSESQGSRGGLFGLLSGNSPPSSTGPTMVQPGQVAMAGSTAPTAEADKPGFFRSLFARVTGSGTAPAQPAPTAPPPEAAARLVPQPAPQPQPAAQPVVAKAEPETPHHTWLIGSLWARVTGSSSAPAPSAAQPEGAVAQQAAPAPAQPAPVAATQPVKHESQPKATGLLASLVNGRSNDPAPAPSVTTCASCASQTTATTPVTNASATPAPAATVAPAPAAVEASKTPAAEPAKKPGFLASIFNHGTVEHSPAPTGDSSETGAAPAWTPKVRKSEKEAGVAAAPSESPAPSQSVTTAKATATAPADGSKPENEPVKKAGFFSRIMGKDTAANAPAAGDAAKPAAPAASDAKAAPATSSKDAEPEPAPRKGFIRSLFSREKKTENPSKDEVAPVKDAAPAKDGPTLPPVKDDKPGSF